MNSVLQHQWQQLNPTRQPPSLRGSSLVFDQKRQQGVLVAGGETWLWDGQTWNQAASLVAPPPRNTAHLVYDTTTACVLLCGGVGLDGTPLNDVWLWNGTLWTEQQPAQRPLPVAGAAIACDVARQQVLFFGGLLGFDMATSTGSNRVGTFSQDTWLWNGSSWTEFSGSGAPPARTGAQMVYDEARQQTLLFGGLGATGYLNDMWLWQGTGWQQLSPQTLPPTSARSSVTFHTQLQQVLLLTDVSTNPLQHSYQTWTWDGQNWSQSAPLQTLPGSVEGFAYDRLRGTIVACVVTGDKMPLTNKQSGSVLPALAAPLLASETWTW